MAELGVSVDTTEVGTAVANLDLLVTAAGKAEAATSKLGATAAAASAKVGSMGAGAFEPLKKAALEYEGVLMRIERMSGVKSPGASFVGRAEDIAAYGNELDRLRAKYNPVFAAQQSYQRNLADIDRAHRVGAISAIEMASAIDRETQALQRLTKVHAPNGQQAANGNTNQGMQRMMSSNLMYQFQDIAVTSAMGMSPAMIALQQGTQIGASLQAMGNGAAGIRALGGAFLALVSPVNLIAIGLTAGVAALIQWEGDGVRKIKNMDEATKKHTDTVGLMTKAYGELRVEMTNTDGVLGSLALSDASMRENISLLRAYAREQGETATQGFRGETWLNSPLGGAPRLSDLSKMDVTGTFAGPIKDLLQSVRNGGPALEKFAADLDKAMQTAIAAGADGSMLANIKDTILGIGESALSVKGEFAPFSDEINKFLLGVQEGNGSFRQFSQNIESIGEANGLQKQADKAIMLGKELATVLGWLEKIGQTDAKIGGDEAYVAMRRRAEASEREVMNTYRLYEAEQRVYQQRQQQGFEADIAGIVARSPEQRIAAVRARESAIYNDNEDPINRGDRINRAAQTERARIEHQLAMAQEERLRAMLSSIDSQQLELRLIGATTREVAEQRKEYELMQALKEEAAREGIEMSKGEIEAVRAVAREYGRVAEAISRAQLEKDLLFESQQMTRGPIDQVIASTMRGAGLDVDFNSNTAALIRYNEQMKIGKDLAKDFFGGMVQDLQNGVKFSEALGNAMQRLGARLLDMALDQAIMYFLKLILGPPPGMSASPASSLGGGGASPFGGLLGGIVNLLSGAAGKGAGAAAGALVPGLGAGVQAGVSVLGGMSAGSQAAASLVDVGSQTVPGRIWNFFAQKGLPSHQIAAIVGAAKAESSFNPTVVNSIGAKGLWQMLSPDRQAGLMRSTGGNLSNVEGQAQHVWNELTGSESAAGRALFSSKNTREATEAMMRFERPDGYTSKNPWSTHDSAARMKYTDQALQKMAGQANVTTGSLKNMGSGLDKMGTGLDTFGSNLSKMTFPSAPGGGGGIGGFFSKLFGGGGGSIIPWSSLSGVAQAAITGGAGGLYANGGVFLNGQVVPHARGDIVSSPTYFPMSGGRQGLMGEDGEEAIMPLGRDSSGRLGVRMAGSNVPSRASYSQQRGRSDTVNVRVTVDDDGKIKAYVQQSQTDILAPAFAAYDRELPGKAIGAVQDWQARGNMR